MTIEVVAYSDDWPRQFERVAVDLAAVLAGVPIVAIEHVGSTSVPGLAAKPILDIDVIVSAEHMRAAILALESAGYVHQGDLGVEGREAFRALDDDPRRHVYVCQSGTLSLRNHLAVRDVLRRRDDLRDEYAAVKRALAADADMDIEAYIARKSAVLQKILAESDLTEAERQAILRLNDPLPGPGDPIEVIGVIDLLDGRAVHARRGERELYEPLRESAGVRIDGDALALAHRYLDLGVAALYVADLDAIQGRPRQDALIRHLAALGVPIWLDAGVSIPAAALACVDTGAAIIIVGLESLGSWTDLAAIAETIGSDRTGFSLDLHDGAPITASPELMRSAPSELAARAVDAGAGAVIVLDLARVGSGRGLDIELIAGVRASAPGVRLIAGGGVRGPDDLDRLADAGCEAALVATALHDGTLVGADRSTSRSPRARLGSAGG